MVSMSAVARLLLMGCKYTDNQRNPPPPPPPVAGVKRRRVTTSRWQAHALGEFDDAVRVARRDGVT